MFHDEAATPAAEEAIPTSGHTLVGSHSGFSSLYPYFYFQRLEDLATLTCILLGDNSQWELSSWPPFWGSCVCYNWFHFYFLISAPLYSFYLIRLAPLRKGACNSYSRPPISTCSSSSHHSWFISSVSLSFLPPTIQCELTLFWILLTFLAFLLYPTECPVLLWSILHLSC